MSLLWGGVDQVWLSKSCCLPTRGSNEWVWSPGLQSSENLSEGFESDFGFEVLIPMCSVVLGRGSNATLVTL